MGPAGKKAAKAELARRIKDASIHKTEASKLTFGEFVTHTGIHIHFYTDDKQNHRSEKGISVRSRLTCFWFSVASNFWRLVR